MTRGVGETALVADLPDAVVTLAAVLTQLGSAWFVLTVVVALYVYSRRRRSPPSTSLPDAIALFGLVFLAFATTTVLKALFGLPRPPGAETVARPAFLPVALTTAYELAATADGFGFPSGHATLAAAFYGGLALGLDAGQRRRRLLAAGAVVAVVGITRIVLGVHYLVDVVAGVAVGAAVAALAARLAFRPTRTLGAALPVALAALALDPGVEPLLTALGATGGLLVCRAVSLAE